MFRGIVAYLSIDSTFLSTRKESITLVNCILTRRTIMLKMLQNFIHFDFVFVTVPHECTENIQRFVADHGEESSYSNWVFLFGSSDSQLFVTSPRFSQDKYFTNTFSEQLHSLNSDTMCWSLASKRAQTRTQPNSFNRKRINLQERHQNVF